METRRVYSETLPYADLVRPRTIELLSRYRLELVLAGDRLHASLANPVKALHAQSEIAEDSLQRRDTENAPRVAALVARKKLGIDAAEKRIVELELPVKYHPKHSFLPEATPEALQEMPWLWAPAGILIAIAVLSINFVGDGLRDALDPRSTKT